MGEDRVAIALVYEPEGWDIPANLYEENDRGVFVRWQDYAAAKMSFFYPWDAVRSVRRYIAEIGVEQIVESPTRVVLGHRIV